MVSATFARRNFALRAKLEFAGMFLCPALDDNFLVGVELDRVATLPVHVAEEAVFPATIREVRHRRGNADVDANISSRRVMTGAWRRRGTRTEERRLIAAEVSGKDRQR